MKPKYYAQGTMSTKDGQILGTVRYNPAQRKWQSSIDGEPSGDFKTKEEAIDDLERAGVKNIKINKDYVMESKIKPTKRDIMIVEDFVKKTTKQFLKESTAGYIETYVDGKQMLGSDGTRVLQNLNTRSVSTIIDQQIKNITSLSKNVKPYLKNAKKIELRVVTKSGSVVKKIDITSNVQG